MKIKEITEDILSMPQGYYLAHYISGDYIPNTDISKRIYDTYNMKNKLDRDYAIPVNKKYANVGRALLIDNVFNLITKQRYFHKSLYEDIYDTFIDMREQINDFGIEKLAIPKLIENGNCIEWDRVLDIIEDVFRDSDVSIVVCSKL